MLCYIDIPKSVPAWHLRWRRLQEGERNRKTLSFMLSVKQVKRFSVPLLFQLINQSDLKSLTEIHTSSYLHHSTKCNVQCISLHMLKKNLNNKYKARSFKSCLKIQNNYCLRKIWFDSQYIYLASFKKWHSYPPKTYNICFRLLAFWTSGFWHKLNTKQSLVHISIHILCTYYKLHTCHHILLPHKRRWG